VTPTNYARGADFERRVGKALSEHGYEVFRAAGSHGKADLCAVKPGQVLLVQCKRNGEIAREEWNELVRLRQALDPRGETVLALLAYMPGRQGIAYRRLLYQVEPHARRGFAYLSWTPDEIGAET
jgi:Holliday junction resolvase